MPNPRPPLPFVLQRRLDDDFLRQISSGGYPLPPTITAITPNFDRVSGGAAVTITGTQFIAGTAVTINGVAATSIVVVDAQTITCNAPANPSGTYDVTVTAPDGHSATLLSAFSYIAGQIVSVSPARGLSSGGQTVLITGVNFVTDSTITFGGNAATNVIFVDSTRFYCTTPAHDDGFVDVVITEPSTAVVTGRNAFGFTSVVFNADIRRAQGIRIRSTLNRGANTAQFQIDGSSIPPIPGEKAIFTDGDTLIFAGQVQNVVQDIEDSRFNKVWTVTASDYSSFFNKKRPFGVWNNVSATQVIKDLIAMFAPGFLSNFVQSGLPRVSVILDGRKDLISVMQDIANSIGEGHFYIDYKKQVHFYVIGNLGALAAAPNQALQLGPGSAMVAAVSTTSTSGYAFVPGWYYFYTSFYYAGSSAVGPNAKVYDALSGTGVSVMATRANASGVFLNYGQGGTPSQAPLPGQTSGAPRYIMLSEQAANRNLQGDISNGVYCTNVLQPRGWTGVDADGNPFGEGAWPAAGPNAIYFASSDVWLSLETASGGQTTPAVADFESALTPISNVVFLQNFLPSFSGVPLGPVVGGRSCTRRNIYAVRFGDPHLSGGTALVGYAHIDDNTTAGPTTPVPGTDGYFKITTVPTVAAPAPPNGVPTAVESTTLNSAATFANANCQPGYYAAVVTSVYQDGTESAATIQSGPVLMTGIEQMRIPNLPIGQSVNGIAVVFRKIYVAIYKPYQPTVTFGIPDLGQGTTLVYIVADNTSIDVTFPIGSGLTGGALTNNSQPPFMRDVNGQPLIVLGPDLEEATNPDDVNNTNMDLLLDPPIQSTSDSTQLRNRIYVTGRGSTITADAAVGATEIKISDVGSFITPSGNGKALFGARIINYSSVTVAIGAGSLLLPAPLSQAVTQSDWTTSGNSPILPLVQVDDIASQAYQGAIETDDDGHATDGIHEYFVSDDNLTTYQQMYARGVAELNQFSRPIISVTYATRDAKSIAGKVVHFDLSNPPLYGDFVIQEVEIDQFLDEIDDQNQVIAPRYKVTCDSAARYTFSDFLLDLSDPGKEQGAGSSNANIIQTAVNVAINGTSGAGSFTPYSIEVSAWGPTATRQTTTDHSAITYTMGTAGVGDSAAATMKQDLKGKWVSSRSQINAGGTLFAASNSSNPGLTLSMAFDIIWRIRTPTRLESDFSQFPVGGSPLSIYGNQRVFVGLLPVSVLFPLKIAGQSGIGFIIDMSKPSAPSNWDPASWNTAWWDDAANIFIAGKRLLSLQQDTIYTLRLRVISYSAINVGVVEWTMNGENGEYATAQDSVALPPGRLMGISGCVEPNLSVAPAAMMWFNRLQCIYTP